MLTLLAGFASEGDDMIAQHGARLRRVECWVRVGYKAKAPQGRHNNG